MRSTVCLEQRAREEMHLSCGMASTRRWEVCLSPRRVRDSTCERRMASRGLAAEAADRRTVTAVAVERRLRCMVGWWAMGALDGGWIVVRVGPRWEGLLDAEPKHSLGLVNREKEAKTVLMIMVDWILERVARDQERPGCHQEANRQPGSNRGKLGIHF